MPSTSSAPNAHTEHDTPEAFLPHVLKALRESPILKVIHRGRSYVDVSANSIVTVKTCAALRGFAEVSHTDDRGGSYLSPYQDLREIPDLHRPIAEGEICYYLDPLRGNVWKASVLSIGEDGKYKVAKLSRLAPAGSPARKLSTYIAQRSELAPIIL